MDDIFKLPPLPKTTTTTTTSASGHSHKRKLEAPTLDPQAYKSVKLDHEVGGHANGNQQQQQASSSSSSSSVASNVTVHEGSDDGDDDDDAAATGGDSFAPGGDADYFAEEDEDGRFFGGGLNPVQKQVLNLMDNNEAPPDASAELTAPSVRRQLLAFEKAIDENRRLRTKFPTDPTKFVDSEFSLLEAIRGLLLLSTAPTLTFPILIELNSLESLADLLSHENTDVFIAVVELLEEWLDPDSLDDEDDDDEEDAGVGGEQDQDADEKRRLALKQLLDTLVQGGLVELAIGGLARLDESDESERGGVFHTLGLIENLVALDPNVAGPLLKPPPTTTTSTSSSSSTASASSFVSYLVKRLSVSKESPEREQNRNYAAEMLALVLSLPVDGVEDARRQMASAGHVDTLLRVLSAYRRRDPLGADETEYMENTFDALCSSLSEPQVKHAFLEGEGIELMCLMLKAQTGHSGGSSHHHPGKSLVAKSRALKTLDYALQGRDEASIALCEHFVEALGLKSLFSTFMGKGIGGGGGKKKDQAGGGGGSVASVGGGSGGGGGLSHQDTEHVLSLLASLLSSLASDSVPRIRLLTKFVEREYEKVDRLIELRDELSARVAANEDPDQDRDRDPDEVYLDKLEHGLFSLQLVDYVVAWVCMEDDGARDHVVMLLARHDRSLNDVIDVLVEYRANIGSGGTGEDDDQDVREINGNGNGDGEETASATAPIELVDEAELQAREQRNILGHLIEYLRGCV